MTSERGDYKAGLRVPTLPNLYQICDVLICTRNISFYWSFHLFVDIDELLAMLISLCWLFLFSLYYFSYLFLGALILSPLHLL